MLFDTNTKQEAAFIDYAAGHDPNGLKINRIAING
jgi:hypothetical protein